MNSFVRRLPPILPTKWTQSILLAIAGVFFTISTTHGQVLPPSTTSSDQEDPTAYLPALFNAPQPPLCDFGVNGGITGFDMTPLRVGWYVNYIAEEDSGAPSGAAHAPIIHLTQTGPESYTFSILPGWVPATDTELEDLIAKHPGNWWFIGNEPDRPNRALTGQDDVEPQVYAIAYHDLYHFIKTADPTAKIVVGNIVQPSPIRLRYLDRVLSSYYSRYGESLRADAWGIHNFLLRECQDGSSSSSYICWGAGIPPGFDGDEYDAMRYLPISGNDDFELFKEQIVRFRQWLADRGYKGAPVYLSEFGVLMPANYHDENLVYFTPDRINTFMTKAFDYLLNEAVDPDLGDPNDGYRLIQRFSWYSVADSSFNGYLYERDPSNFGQFALSPMGVNFANYAAGIAEVAEPYPVQIDFTPGAPLASSGNVTFTLTALVANSGNNALGKTFPVRFFDGDPATGGKQIGADQTVTLAGCGDTATAQVEWPNIEPGEYQIYVQVDPDGANKIIDRRVGFANAQVFTPQVKRGMYLQ